MHYPLNVQIIFEIKFKMLRREILFRIIIRHYLCSNRGVKVQFFQFFALSGTGRVQRDSHGRKSEDPCVTTTAKAVPFESFAFHFESRATPRNRQS